MRPRAHRVTLSSPHSVVPEAHPRVLFLSFILGDGHHDSKKESANIATIEWIGQIPLKLPLHLAAFMLCCLHTLIFQTEYPKTWAAAMCQQMLNVVVNNISEKGYGVFLIQDKTNLAFLVLYTSKKGAHQ
jgi:hypothetical protein|mmetsp:Transcript_6993/g.13299  ORF Transcript_6993/g.13299 Transcript_6993/m.13299 type:complete len:130 (+) Transcript_6993:668-1057(+)